MLIIGRGRIGNALAEAIDDAHIIGHNELNAPKKNIPYSTIVNCTLDPRLYKQILTINELMKSLFIDKINKNTSYIYLSTRMVYAKEVMINATEDARTTPSSFYGENKLRQEEILLRELPREKLTILRLPNLIFTNTSAEISSSRPQFMEVFAINMMKFRKIELSGTKSTIKDFLHADDLIDIIRKIKNTHLNGIYNAGYGHGITFNELIEIALCIDDSLVINWKICDADDSFYLNSEKIKKVINIPQNQKSIIKEHLIKFKQGKFK